MSERAADAKIVKASEKSFVSGIVSAAADNDPTTVATLAVVGASLIYQLEWLIVLIVPMFTIVQAIATQVAAVTRKSMQEAVRRRYGMTIGVVSLVSIIAVNVITYAADLDAGAAALSLLTNVDYRWFVVPISIVVYTLLVFGSMEKVRRVLMLVPIVFLAYIATAFMAHPNWHDVARGLIPTFHADKDFVASIIAMIGTTLTVYSYYWQTVEVAEDAPPRRAIPFVQVSALPGTIVTGIVLWFILVGTASTLGVHHHQAETAQDAAQALAPVAGRWASVLFGVGLFGSAMLALPVIAAGSANAVASSFGWEGNLNSKPRNAMKFYLVLFLAVATGTGITFLAVKPIALLFYASIAAGFATPLTLALLVMVGSDKRTMGTRPIARPLSVAGWCVTAIITVSAVAFIRWH